jgi:hypothetical protein
LGSVGHETAAIFAVCDGAGSAAHSAIAAKLVSAQFCAEFAAFAPVPVAAIAEDVIEVVAKIRAALETKAAAMPCELRELSTTLIGGCVGREGGWVCQIGDGAAVVQRSGVFRPATWPSNGEYANTTTFLTSDDWRSEFQFQRVEGPVEAFGAFTDGLQDLILRHADKTVHSPFFEPLLSKLREFPEAGRLDGPLRNLLDSKTINDRTDDDKTLVVACWTD